MKNIGDKIKELRVSKNWTKRELANRLNVHESSINKYEKNIVDLPLSKVRELSRVLNVSEAYLMGWTNIKENRPAPPIFTKDDILKVTSTIKIPLVGEICAGGGTFAEENFERIIVVDEDTIKADYALTVRGDSMIESNIFHGDIALFDKVFEFKSGEIYAVVVSGEETGSIKKVYQQGATFILEACNKDYSPSVHSSEEITIRGKYKGLIRNEF